MLDNAAPRDELPEVSDEDVALLHQICTLANHGDDPPFKSLFAAYDHVFAEQGIQQAHDGVVFRLLLRVGELAREGGGNVRRVDLVARLKDILAAHGITVIDDEDDDGEWDGEGVDLGEEETRSVTVSGPHAQQQSPGGDIPGAGVIRAKKRGSNRRRVSFDDARLEETWLSEHSRDFLTSPQRHQLPRQTSLPSQPSSRGGPVDTTLPLRSQSVTSQRRSSNDGVRHSVSARHQQAFPSTTHTFEPDLDNEHPILLFKPSWTQLKQSASAFLSTSSIRTERRCLHVWHDAALLLRQKRHDAFRIAETHDCRTLLKQAFDQWRTSLYMRKETQRDSAYWENEKNRAEQLYRSKVLYRAFTHWVVSTHDQRRAITFAERKVLRLRYFYRWRAIAMESAAKSRSILTRKYLAAWRERQVKRQVSEERAESIYEENLVKSCWHAWFWQFCSRRVKEWREDKVKRRTLSVLIQHLHVLRDQQQRAQNAYDTRVERHTLELIRQHLVTYRRAEETSEAHRTRKLYGYFIQTLRIEAKLMPIAQTLSLKIRFNLQRKAFNIWHAHVNLSKEAVGLDRKRLLKSTWTSWNDALRCKALAQHIDERVLVECLYKWVLQERLKLFCQSVDDTRIVRQSLLTWRNYTEETRARTREVEQQLAESQQRRLLSSAMRKLHLAMRQREDADRAAVELANTHSLVPYALQTLAQKTEHIRELNKWADDARFYTLTDGVLRYWKDKTMRQQHTRRREAYRVIRARIKARLARECLRNWCAKVEEIRSMREEAERRAYERLFRIGEEGLHRWRQKTARATEMEWRASDLDQQKLLTSALGAVQQRVMDRRAMDVQAKALRRYLNLALQGAALKKVQWAQFTATRRAESAEALFARNRDNHVRQMVRHWAAHMAAIRAANQTPALGAEVDEDADPDSPSLRPASRAASRSLHRPLSEHTLPTSSPTATPAYMRTPSRSARAGRFRPIPTPKPVTPFAFDTADLGIPPAPASSRNIMRARDLREEGNVGATMPQMTPFERKLRSGGLGVNTPEAPTPRTLILGRSTAESGMAKSVRFAGGWSSRFGGQHLKSS